MPTIQDFFSNRAFTAAYTEKRNNNSSFLDFYRELVQCFRKLFDEDWSNIQSSGVGNFSSVIKKAKKNALSLCDSITNTIDKYLNGDTFGAYNLFSKALKKNKDDLEKNFGIIPNPLHLFRIRESENPAFDVKERKNIFHVPFSQRHNIGNNRFSISGFPCLYLGCSLYVCWEELGRPPFNKISFSRFQYSDNYSKNYQSKLMYLNVSPKAIEENFIKNEKFYFIGGNQERFCNYLKTYPLQLACSIPCQITNAKFQAEYIIPQLLMQWIRGNNDYHGICYRTANVSQLPSSLFIDSIRSENKYLLREALLSNYAYPVMDIKGEYCCELTKLFKFTDPIAYDLSLACQPRDPEGGRSIPKVLLKQSNQTPISLAPDTATLYSFTDFAKAEFNSSCFDASPLTLNERT
jgi:hypothetical protein